MFSNGNRFEENIKLSPNDWLFWKDEEFNNWRREHDFPRIVEFLFDSLPYFSLWLSEQQGLTEQDLLFHGPARFIRFYGEDVAYLEHDAGMSLFKDIRAPKIVRYEFIEESNIKNLRRLKILRQLRFTSYIDWAFAKSAWAFPNKIKDIRDIALFFTPSGRTSNSLDYLNSNSYIQFNIPLFMPSLTLEARNSRALVKAPPRLGLLKLGGGGVEIKNGFIGEKNLEFTNIDNLTLISPIITSFQTITFSTLRNLTVTGPIHALNLYQCSVELFVKNGELSSCRFEHGEQVIDLNNSLFDRSTIRSRKLNVKLFATELLDCKFEYSNPFNFSPKENKDFHNSAKMIFSHLGYADLAGEHFLMEKKAERRNMWKLFSSIKSNGAVRTRFYALFRFLWMSLQELYWGYGEKPINIILSSIVIILAFSTLGYFEQSSSTYSDAMKSLIFAFKSYTNVSLSDIKQTNEALNMLGAVMSFFGLISVGLLIAALSSKSKDYN
jgi:hypothetical protein